MKKDSVIKVLKIVAVIWAVIIILGAPAFISFTINEKNIEINVNSNIEATKEATDTTKGNGPIFEINDTTEPVTSVRDSTTSPVTHPPITTIAPNSDSTNSSNNTVYNPPYRYVDIVTTDQSFYGVFCFASLNLSEAQAIAATRAAYIIIRTDDWSNLNSEPYYAVSFGIYQTKAEAESALPEARLYYPDAYVRYSGNKKAPAPVDEHEVDMTCGNIGKSFYGVWCQADKSYNYICDAAEHMRSLGFDARIYFTPDWSNLNKEPYYAVSIGEHATMEDANKMLEMVLDVYPEAYVKYSGIFK